MKAMRVREFKCSSVQGFKCKLLQERRFIMAEKNTPKAPSAVDTQTPSTVATCSIPGCVHHIEGTTSSGKQLYKYRTHFKSMQQVYEHAGESMQRVVAYRARTGKALPIPTDGSFVDIDHTGVLCDTYDNLYAKLQEMSTDERTAYERSLQMQLDALKRAQSTSHADAKAS